MADAGLTSFRFLLFDIVDESRGAPALVGAQALWNLPCPELSRRAELPPIVRLPVIHRYYVAVTPVALFLSCSILSRVAQSAAQ
jgi:hypothetical protein